jgi:hypothetical protein
MAQPDNSRSKDNGLDLYGAFSESLGAHVIQRAFVDFFHHRSMRAQVLSDSNDVWRL